MELDFTARILYLSFTVYVTRVKSVRRRLDSVNESAFVVIIISMIFPALLLLLFRFDEKYANSGGNELIGFSMKIERIRMRVRMRGMEISLSNLHMARSRDE